MAGHGGFARSDNTVTGSPMIHMPGASSGHRYSVGMISLTMSWPDSPFWNYSIALYGNPEVEHACLALQNRHGLNVNLLLLACWLADQGIELDEATHLQAEAAVSAWQEKVVQPLRAVRQQIVVQMQHAEERSLVGRWRDHVVALRKAISSLELDSEHLAQLALSDLVGDLQVTHTASVELAGRNLAHCWAFKLEDRSDLENLLKSSFPNATDLQSTRALQAISTDFE